MPTLPVPSFAFSRCPTFLRRGFGLLLVWTAVTASLGAAVHVERVPGGGLQPQIVQSAEGTLHLVYLAGTDRAADVYYSHRSPQATAWAEPVRVNHVPGAAIAVGTIRGADLALGKDGLVHVVWNGSDRAEPRPKTGSPLLYSRQVPGGTAFERERNLSGETRHLDGGGSVAADAAGRVYVVWHASGPAVPDGEEARTVFLAQSEDNGKTFAAERSISPASVGACGCCGLKAHATRDNAVVVLFREAAARENRDFAWLVSRDQGRSFSLAGIDPWKATQCPMSLPGISEDAAGLLFAWETGRHVRWTSGDPARGQSLDPVVTPTGEGRRKHPQAVRNHRGETLVVWSEGTGWQKGGAVEWQLFDAERRPSGGVQRREGLPVWARPAATDLPSGDFLVLY